MVSVKSQAENGKVGAENATTGISCEKAARKKPVDPFLGKVMQEGILGCTPAALDVQAREPFKLPKVEPKVEKKEDSEETHILMAIGNINERLHAAVKTNNEIVVRDAIGRGAAVDQWDVLRKTPLIYAIELGHKDMVKLLLEKGADPDYCMFNGLSAREFAMALNQPDTAEMIRERTVELKLEEIKEYVSNDMNKPAIGIDYRLYLITSGLGGLLCTIFGGLVSLIATSSTPAYVIAGSFLFGATTLPLLARVGVKHEKKFAKNEYEATDAVISYLEGRGNVEQRHIEFFDNTVAAHIGFMGRMETLAKLGNGNAHIVYRLWDDYNKTKKKNE